MNAPRAGVVPPPPDLRGSMTRAGLIAAGRLGSVSAGAADLSIVPPPPSINDHAVLTSGARGNLSTTGVQVVAPPPSIQAGAKPDGRGRAISLAGEGSQVVPPPPSLEGAGNFVGRGRTNSLANGVSQVVPPPPSVEGGGNSDAGGRASSLARAGAEGVLPPASAQGAGNPGPSGARVANDAPTPSVPEVGGNRMHPIFQDVQLRVIGLAWAPPRSSYFSNFEVFIAEKGPNKGESQLIKLVYVFLPYQPRLSEYGFDNLKVRWLRVARDPTCDEGLMQMMRPEGENGPAGYHSGDALASTSSDRNNVLPCYRTTADDYRRAVSRSR